MPDRVHELSFKMSRIDAETVWIETSDGTGQSISIHQMLDPDAAEILLLEKATELLIANVRYLERDVTTLHNKTMRLTLGGSGRPLKIEVLP